MQPSGLFNTQTPGNNTGNQNQLFGFNSNSNNNNQTTNTNNINQKPTTVFGPPNTGTTQNQPLFGAPTPGATQNQPLFGATTTGTTQSQPLFGAPTSGATQNKPLFGAPAAGTTTENKPLFGAPTTGTTDNKHLFGAPATGTTTENKPLFGAPATGTTDNKPLFGAPTAGTTTENKPLFGAPATGTTNNKPLFGASSSTGTTENKPLFGGPTTGTTETKPLFGAPATGTNQQTSTDNKQTVLNNTTSLNQQSSILNTSTIPNNTTKSEADKTTKPQEQPLKETLPLKPPEPSPNDITQLDSLTVNSLYKKTLEEVITNWRLELESQSSKMNQITNIYRRLETNLLSNYDMARHLYSVKQKLQTEAESSLSQLKDINTEEEQIIEQLNYMNNSLTHYLDQCKIGNDKEFELYNNINESAKRIDSIGKEIAQANAKVEIKSDIGDRRGSYGFEYENDYTKEKVFVDQQELNDIFNGFYVAIRSIKNMEDALSKKINNIEMEINDKKKDILNNRTGNHNENLYGNHSSNNGVFNYDDEMMM
jgi:hypothetical protein